MDLIISLRTQCVYSWEEIGRRLGLGSRQVEYVYRREAASRGLAKLPPLQRGRRKPKPKVEPKVKVKTPKPKPKPDPKRRMPQADKELILKLYEQGLEWQDIADRIDDPLTDVGCCRNYIYKRAYIHRRKVKPKPKRKVKVKVKTGSRRTVSGGCRVCNGMVSFVLTSNRSEDIERLSGVCDTCNTLFQITQVLDVNSILSVQRVDDEHEDYLGRKMMRLGRLL